MMNVNIFHILLFNVMNYFVMQSLLGLSNDVLVLVIEQINATATAATTESHPLSSLQSLPLDVCTNSLLHKQPIPDEYFSSGRCMCAKKQQSNSYDLVFHKVNKYTQHAGSLLIEQYQLGKGVFDATWTETWEYVSLLGEFLQIQEMVNTAIGYAPQSKQNLSLLANGMNAMVNTVLVKVQQSKRIVDIVGQSVFDTFLLANDCIRAVVEKSYHFLTLVLFDIIARFDKDQEIFVLIGSLTMIVITYVYVFRIEGNNSPTPLQRCHARQRHVRQGYGRRRHVCRRRFVPLPSIVESQNEDQVEEEEVPRRISRRRLRALRQLKRLPTILESENEDESDDEVVPHPSLHRRCVRQSFVCLPTIVESDEEEEAKDEMQKNNDRNNGISMSTGNRGDRLSKIKIQRLYRARLFQLKGASRFSSSISIVGGSVIQVRESKELDDEKVRDEIVFDTDNEKESVEEIGQTISLRRSTRKSKPPSRYGEYECCISMVKETQSKL